MKESLKRNSTITVRVMCAIVFIAFTFCYVYFYQADVLAFLQHVLSGGQTSYERTVGAVIITVLMVLVQQLLYRLTKLYKRAHALTYFPSVVLLSVLTDVTADGHFNTRWLWLAPMLLVLFGVLTWLSKQFETYEPGKENPGFFSRTMWVNMLSLFVMFFFMVTVSNNNATIHHRLFMEQRLVKGHYEEALKAGVKSHETDSSLTMLRVYALARQGLLGERLFRYPVVGGKAMMLPDGTTAKTLIMNPKIIKAFSMKKGKADYLLMGYLLDRDLDGFARHVGNYYRTDSTDIPRHYREALVLYTHLRSNRVLTYKDEVLDADYEDYRALQKKYPDHARRAAAVRDVYGSTYWWYYESESAKRAF